jgi:NAD(P)H-hydrate repair Nnr-like enzyme with NAD(P)H-hydrate epimerase domain
VVTTVGDDLGNNYVKITSFAAFFIEGTGGNGNDAYILGRYLPDVQVSNTVSGTSSKDFGVYVSKLTE